MSVSAACGVTLTCHVLTISSHLIRASASTIVKLVIIIRLNHAKGDQVQPMHYQLLLWADSELGLAIFAASLAAIRPLLVRFHITKLSKWSTTRSKGANPGASSTNATGPYKEIKPADLSQGSGKLPSDSYVKRLVTIDVESFEMGQVDSNKRPLHESRTAVWTDDRSEKGLWNDLEGRKQSWDEFRFDTDVQRVKKS